MEIKMKIQKMKEWAKKNFLIIFLVINILPIVLAYSTPLQIPTIWDVVVEGIFGSFWISVIFITLIYFIILALGGISAQTNIVFNSIFILCMALGYYSPLVAFGIIVVSLILGINAMIKFVSGV